MLLLLYIIVIFAKGYNMEYSQEIENIWSMALQLIRQSYSESTFNLWFADTQPIDLTEKKFIISTPTAFKKNIISSRHRDVVEQALQEVLGFYIEAAVLTETEAQQYKKSGAIPVSPSQRKNRHRR